MERRTVVITAVTTTVADGNTKMRVIHSGVGSGL